jgi:DNA-binding XRE family transcriptional regulator
MAGTSPAMTATVVAPKTRRGCAPARQRAEIRIMSRPKIITTPSGDRMVIPFEEYERLIEAAEDAADARAADEIKRRLATGEEELIPAEIVDRMIDGENRLRVWREYRGMSARQLAEATGLAAPYISQLETGKREGTIVTFKKIAAALRVDIDDIA